MPKQCDPGDRDVLCFVGKPGEKERFAPSAPEISLVRGGKRAYLWVGNDLRIGGKIVDGHCFATLSGVAALRALANAILEEVGS